MNEINKSVEIKDALRLRILKAKAAIFVAIAPAKTYMPFVLQFFPEFASEKEQDKVRRAMNLQFLDEEMVEKLERLPDLIKRT